MGLPASSLKLLAPYMRGANILSLGYPDLTVDKEQIKKIFGVSVEKTTDANVQHNIEQPLPDTEELIEKIGSKLTVVDVVKVRGNEIVADLNEPHDFGTFDLVLDPGTLEHCFNYGQAFRTAVSSVRVGGKIFHISPMTMINHGFFNISPTLYFDFYKQNGWKLNELAVVPCDTKKPNILKRFNTHLEYMLRCLATRHETGFRWPIQNKYLEKK